MHLYFSHAKKEDFLQVTANRKSAHSSLPGNGINAIWTLARFLETLDLAPNGADRLIDFVAQYLVNDYYGKMLGLWNENDYLNGEFIHHTTVVPTLLDSGDNSFTVTCNLRPSFGVDRNDIDAAISKVETAFGCNGELLSYLEPLYVPVNTPFIGVISCFLPLPF